MDDSRKTDGSNVLYFAPARAEISSSYRRTFTVAAALDELDAALQRKREVRENVHRLMAQLDRAAGSKR